MYGTTTQLAARPRCWGKTTEYDTESRECRGCSFQESCRSEVLRALNRQAQQTPAPSTASYYAQYQQPQASYAVPQPYASPAPAPGAVAPRPVPMAPAPAPVAAAPAVVQYRPQTPAPQQVQAMAVPQQQQVPARFQDWYGRVQDPMFYAVTTAPPPFRPQFEGETFGERVMKNAGLAMAEAAVGQVLLAIRQMFLPPGPVRPTSDQVVDVTPGVVDVK